MYIAAGVSVGMGLLGMSEQRKANSQAQDAASKANAENNKLRDLALPYISDNLRTNANLQKFYQNNPFSDQQKTGYQNQNNLADSFNGQVAPGLLNFANQMMGQGYSRQRGGTPGSVAGYGGSMQAGGMQPNAMQGLLAGPFSAPQHQAFGQIDFNKVNPFSAQNKEDPANAAQINVKDSFENFDPAAYMAANPDVKADPWASAHPWEHFNGWGRTEGRKFTPKG